MPMQCLGAASEVAGDSENQGDEYYNILNILYKIISRIGRMGRIDEIGGSTG